jgi:hypothetical protein
MKLNFRSIKSIGRMYTRLGEIKDIKMCIQVIRPAKGLEIIGGENP